MLVRGAPEPDCSLDCCVGVVTSCFDCCSMNAGKLSLLEPSFIARFGLPAFDVDKLYLARFKELSL